MMKWGSVDRDNYAGDNKKFLEPEIAANVRTIVAEYSVAKLYKQPLVFPFYPNSEHPYIEVKSVRTRDAIPVFPKDVEKSGILVGVRVLDRDYYSEVEVYGWLPVEECNKPEWFYEPERSWRVPLDAFNDTILV